MQDHTTDATASARSDRLHNTETLRRAITRGHSPLCDAPTLRYAEGMAIRCWRRATRWCPGCGAFRCAECQNLTPACSTIDLSTLSTLTEGAP